MPPDRSLTITTRLLAELEDEQTWQSRFVFTTDGQWDSLVTLFREETVAGEAISTDEVFPVEPLVRAQLKTFANDWVSCLRQCVNRLARLTDIGSRIPLSLQPLGFVPQPNLHRLKSLKNLIYTNVFPVITPSRRIMQRLSV